MAVDPRHTNNINVYTQRYAQQTNGEEEGGRHKQQQRDEEEEDINNSIKINSNNIQKIAKERLDK
jgi:hypothetical protein